MNKQRGLKFKDVFLVIFFIISILIGIYFVFIKDAADKKSIETSAIIDECIVCGQMYSFEYWRSTLNESQRIVYDEAKEAQLKFLDEFSTYAEAITRSEFNSAMDALKYDHPEIFWNRGYEAHVIGFTNIINTNKKIKLYYSYNKEEVQNIKSHIDSKINEIVLEANSLDNDYKKIRFVHDRLIEIGNYSDYSFEERDAFQSIVSIFDTGNTVCVGYTYGFKLIMDRLGIDSITFVDLLNDNKDENHTWNMVKLYDKWYNIDITWDDRKKYEGVIAYNFFLKDNEEFYTTHRMLNNIPQN